MADWLRHKYFAFSPPASKQHIVGPGPKTVMAFLGDRVAHVCACMCVLSCWKLAQLAGLWPACVCLRERACVSMRNVWLAEHLTEISIRVLAKHCSLSLSPTTNSSYACSSSSSSQTCQCFQPHVCTTPAPTASTSLKLLPPAYVRQSGNKSSIVLTAAISHCCISVNNPIVKKKRVALYVASFSWISHTVSLFREFFSC